MQIELNTPKSANEKVTRLTPAEFTRIMSDPVYYINEYCYTFDPLIRAKGHNLMPFKLYPFQEGEIPRIVNHIRQGRDLFYEKSRDMGISWIVMAISSWFWNFEPAFQAIYGSRVEDAVDNFQFDSLFGKVDIILDNLPFAPDGFSKKNRTKLKVVNPMNGNLLKGESSNPNWSRSGRYTLGVMDEIAFWDDAAEAWGSAQDSCSCVIAITTPAKKPHFSKALRNSGIVPVVTLHWRVHPLKDDAWYEQEKATRLPEDLAREVDINWEGSITGRYMPEVAHTRLGEFPYNPSWPLWVSHDPGHFPDPHSLGWFQINPQTGRYMLIESFERDSRVIDWYLPMFYNPDLHKANPIDSQFSYNEEERALIAKVSEWKGATHFGDPAGRIGNEVSGKSVYDRLLEFNISVGINGKLNDHYSRRSGAAKILMNLDVNDTPNNRLFLERIKNARLPDTRDGSQRTSENDKPLHDWTSHSRSMLEYFGVNVDWNPTDLIQVDSSFQTALARIQSRNRQSHIIGRN